MIARDSAPPKETSLVTGTRLGRYEILEVLGRGGQSIAYKALDPKIDRIVAVKQILSKTGLPEAARTEFLARFMREAQAAGRLSHPNIATIYDVGGDEEGEPYIAMEHVDGCDLDELIRNEHPLSQGRILRLFVQLCSALDYAHDAGIVHRDIKPGNIMVTRDDRVKVVDFGIAKMDSMSLTQAGMVMGTPSYMSPEQIMGKPLDRRSDIFSLGVVLYETLTGEKPFIGEHWTTVSFKIVNELHASVLIRERDPSLLPEFDSILNLALAKAPAARYQTCAEMGRALALLLEDRRISPLAARGHSEGAAASVAITDAAVSSTVVPAPGVAPGASSGATAETKSGPVLAMAHAQHGDDLTVIIGSELPTGKIASTPPTGSMGESLAESASRAANAIDAESTVLRSSSDAAPSADWSFTISKVSGSVARSPTLPPSASPGSASSSPSEHDTTRATDRAGRRRSVLVLAVAAAVFVAVILVVVLKFPWETVPEPNVAASTMKAVTQAPPSAVAVQMMKSREALANGLIVGRDGKDALYFVTEALALDPDNAEARALESDIRLRALQQADDLRKQGDAAEVKQELDVRRADSPNDTEIQAQLDAAKSRRSRTRLAAEVEHARIAGETAFDAGNYAEASTQFSKLTGIDPLNASAYYSLGRTNLARNARADAEKNLTRACELEPGNPTYNIQLSRVLESNGKLAAALDRLEKGLELGGDRENSTTSLRAHASMLRFRIDLGQMTPHTFVSKHVHRFGGRCNGQLVVTQSGINFIPDEKKDHAFQSTWQNVKAFSIARNRLEVELSGNKQQSFECAELGRLTGISEAFSRRH